jgi:hypothetical protein
MKFYEIYAYSGMDYSLRLENCYTSIRFELQWIKICISVEKCFTELNFLLKMNVVGIILHVGIRFKFHIPKSLPSFTQNIFLNTPFSEMI